MTKHLRLGDRAGTYAVTTLPEKIGAHYYCMFRCDCGELRRARTEHFARPMLCSKCSFRRLKDPLSPPFADVRGRLEYLSIPEPNSGCLLWLGNIVTFGHGILRTPQGDALAHRLSWEFAFGPIPDGLCCLHKCDVPACINPAHLFLGTKADNNADRHRKGRYDPAGWQGERHGMAEISEATALEILNAKGNHADIARRFGMDRSHVWRIRTGRSWKHLHQLGET